jgi:hypothetical protein
MSECPICYVEKSNILCLEPCKHTICSDCLDKYLYFDIRCHLCKTTIRGSIPPLYYPPPIIKKIEFEKKEHEVLGITLVKKNDAVIIQNIEKNSMASRYNFCKGDKILGINTIPCYNVETAQKYIRESSHIVTVFIELPQYERNIKRGLCNIFFRKKSRMPG